MIDTHCHIDLYEHPLDVLNECRKAGIIVIGMTNLPSHFEMGYPHVLPFKKIRLALGMHPLYAESHEKEFPLFIKNLHKTSYIGEVGLDFSREGYATKTIQLDSFQKILGKVTGENKILSLHSRRAEKEVLELLIENRIENAIFHWYSGPLALIDKIVEAGYFLSINTAMINSEAGKKIIARAPADFILTESDGPFIEINNMPVKPMDIIHIHHYLSNIWGKSIQESSNIIKANLQKLTSSIRLGQ
jgi:TatD DNase family protein